MKINQKNKILFLFSLSLIIYSCSDNSVGVIYPPDNSYKVTISQGVWGNVWFWEGNFMPTTDNSSNGKITPVIREIYVYEATRFDSVEIDSINYVFIKRNYTNRMHFHRPGLTCCLGNLSLVSSVLLLLLILEI